MLQAGRSSVRVPDEVDFFNLPNSSNRTMALGSTQPLTEMSTRNLPGGKKRPARKADNLSASISRMSENVGASTSRNPKSLHGLYRKNLTFYLTSINYIKTAVCIFMRSNDHVGSELGIYRLHNDICIVLKLIHKTLEFRSTFFFSNLFSLDDW
jgi:hypothetical protein